MARIKSISIDVEADAAYVSLFGGPVARTDEVGEGIIIDYGADGRPVGVEILSVQQRVGSGEAHSYLKDLVEGLLVPGREAAE